MAGASASQARWELENDVASIADADAFLTYDDAGQKAFQASRPWAKEPQYFQKVQVSALALLKMAMHANSGGNIEVMGILQGKVMKETFIVVDVFALPVEGSETRVNAQAEAYEFMIDFMETCKSVGRLENAVGWYHSHPGYGCWLSGIDCSTQMMQQKFQDPFLAIVVDPHRTIAAGKVEIGAFRTYPEGYKPPNEPASEYQTIPMNKIEDFGVHCKSYYPLDISFFKSSLDAHILDLLWHKYWVNTLSSSPLITTRHLAAGQYRDVVPVSWTLLWHQHWVNTLSSSPLITTRRLAADQYRDVAEKLAAAETSVANSTKPARFLSQADKKAAGDQGQLKKVARDAPNLAVEQAKGLSTQVVKDYLLNFSPQLRPPAAAPTQMLVES